MMKKIYFADTAHCYGSGHDTYRSVVGLPRVGSEEHKAMMSADIVLVTSNTGFCGETVKRVVFDASGKKRPRTAPPELRFGHYLPGLQTVNIGKESYV